MRLGGARKQGQVLLATHRPTERRLGRVWVGVGVVWVGARGGGRCGGVCRRWVVVLVWGVVREGEGSYHTNGVTGGVWRGGGVRRACVPGPFWC